MRALLSFVVLVASLGGCKSYCRQLSEKLCDCEVTSTARTNCLTSAASKEANASLTAEAEDRCEALLPGCDCAQRYGAEGKVACGLAWPVPEADAGL